MQSHSWLLIATVAAFATVGYSEAAKMPLADDPLFNKMLATTEENKSEFASKAPIRIPLADDPR